MVRNHAHRLIVRVFTQLRVQIAVKNCFIRGSVVRNVQIPAEAISKFTNLLIMLKSACGRYSTLRRRHKRFAFVSRISFQVSLSRLCCRGPQSNQMVNLSRTTRMSKETTFHLTIIRFFTSNPNNVLEGTNTWRSEL